MTKQGFDNQKYLTMQSQHIQERIAQFGGKLYLEFGGKLFDDFHASRVLPGFEPDSKIRMLAQMKDKAEIVLVINAADIEKNKVRGDLGITYDSDVLRLIDAFRGMDLYVGSVVVTQYAGQQAADQFQKRLETLGVRVYRHYPIPGYPHNIAKIVSDEGFGKNDYVETTRPLVVITAPGPGSGKMATCLSQLYHEHKRGVTAATADLDDVNMIDPFHLQAYGVTTVNYNRDVEVFPVLSAMFEKITGSSPYKSPTDMGVNMAGNCIYDDEACQEAARQEIVRRYYTALCEGRQGKDVEHAVYKLELLMQQAGVTTEDRAVVAQANQVAEETGEPAMAIELPDGQMVTGKTSELMGCSAAALLNALKALSGVGGHVISQSAIEPIQTVKVKYLGSNNPRLHSDEVLVALASSANADPKAAQALSALAQLKGCQAHCSVILSEADESTYKRLGLQLTCEPQYQTNKLYHR